MPWDFFLKDQKHKTKSNIDRYRGMTVNERLYLSGMMDDYEKAVKRKDFTKAESILGKLDIGNENVKTIIKANKQTEEMPLNRNLFMNVIQKIKKGLRGLLY